MGKGLSPEELRRLRAESRELQQRLADRIAYNERLIQQDREREERRRRRLRRLTFGLLRG